MGLVIIDEAEEVALARVRDRGERIRGYIVENVDEHPSDITKLTMAEFGISRQAVNTHVHRLTGAGALLREGSSRNPTYKLAPLSHWSKTYDLTDTLTEDRVWREDVAPALGQLPQNVLDLWQYSFTEMFNNALEHSEGTFVGIDFERTAARTELSIHDDGVGIFKKIQAALSLLDERHSVLELAKGKFTTDPAHHSGEGVFFVSRMLDYFLILSGGVMFSHDAREVEDWIMERDRDRSGTTVVMDLGNHASRTSKHVFDNYTSGDDYGFTKTVVPVKLTKYGDDNLVSRSQARRLLSRIERFRVVMLDFEGVDAVGQAFADEVFRVFPAQHPEVTLIEINAGSAVKRMISRARSV